jgi:FkbH-like protein
MVEPRLEVPSSAVAIAAAAPADPPGVSRGSNLSRLTRRIINKAKDTANAIWSLRGCNSVGLGARVKGRVRIENRGSITIGKRFNLSGRWIPVEILTGRAGQVEIGHEVWINFGTVISARSRITIGDRSQIGQHCIICDSDFPDMSAPTAVLPSGSIEIGENVWIAGRVTVRPGVKIGSGAVIVSGSIVESDVPPNVIAGGIPARVLAKVAHEPDALNTAAATRAASPEAGSTRVISPSQPRAAAPGVAALPAPVPALHGHLIADFTIDELVKELLVADVHPAVAATVAPFDQVPQMLMAPAPPGTGDFAVVWTRPQRAVPSFAKLLAFENTDSDSWRTEVDEFCTLIERAAASYRFVFVPSWTLPPAERGLGMLDGRKGGAAATLTAMNLRLMERFELTPNVFVLNANRWFEAIGPAAINPKAWYLGKIAVSRLALTEAARDIRAGLSALSGGPRKLLVVDLDDTLWGGIVGDVGWENLRLGGLDGSGEAFVDFQKGLKDLKRRGVVLAIVSKNEESVALEAIRKHPSMVLQEADFVAWRINWTDKAKNILELTQELNLGLQSVVFIDDNPVERTRVREALPEVYVPDWPAEEFFYPSALRALRCFDAPSLSREDLERTRMYGEESQREALKRNVGSIDEWLKSLGVTVSAAALGPSTTVRAAQLLNKTNQLNLATRRLTESELVAWAAHPNRRFYVISVADRLGEAGLTGLLGLEFENDVAHIVDFVLSCRVMGRKVEETMVHIAVASAIDRGATTVLAKYLPTAKNKPCLSFWQSSGFEPVEQNVFSWKTADAYPLHDAISLDWQR